MLTNGKAYSWLVSSALILAIGTAPGSAAAGDPCKGMEVCQGGDSISVVVRAPGAPPAYAPSNPSHGATTPQLPVLSSNAAASSAAVQSQPTGGVVPIPIEKMSPSTYWWACLEKIEFFKGVCPTDATSPAAPSAAPGSATPKTPTATPLQAAQQAWTTQVFTKPTVSIQPVGNLTVTGLPTYFQATFGPDGLAPGETVTTTLLGNTVTIRPTDVKYTYHFGDGTSTGPTPDAGGPYPSGKITHTYTKKAVVTTRIDVTLSGEYQIGGGAWQTIPGSTTVTGNPQQLTVAIMQSRLHD